MRYLISILTLFCSINLCAYDYTIDTLNVFSGTLNENRLILFFKPTGLQKSDTVSIVYLLDGESSQSLYDHIATGQFNVPIIGIGIVNTYRNRDLLPIKEPDKFLDFITNELIPTIEPAYNVNRRILFGHSFAGGFTIYSMLNKSGMFDQYIASSPTPIMNMVDTSFYKQLDSKLDKEIKFYFSYGSNDMKQVKKWNSILNNNLTHADLKHIHWKNEVYECENHNTSNKVSMIKGLRY